MKKLVFGLYVLVTIALLIWGYYQAIYVAPNDARQGEIFRIIYYHVPSFAVAFVILCRQPGRLHWISRFSAQLSRPGADLRMRWHLRERKSG